MPVEIVSPDVPAQCIYAFRHLRMSSGSLKSESRDWPLRDHFGKIGQLEHLLQYMRTMYPVSFKQKFAMIM